MEGEIDLKCFLDCVATHFCSKESEIRKKALMLEKQYECFKSDKPPPHKQHHGGHHSHSQSHSHTRKEKPSERKPLFEKDLSIDSIIRKNMTTLMNKISATNKEHIISQVRSGFREDHAHVYASIIWEYMILSPDHQDVYTDVVILLPPVMSMHMNDLWRSWFDARGWIVHTNDAEDYDEFCSYVKSKKRSIAIMKAIGQLTKKNVLPRPAYNTTVSAIFETCAQFLKEGNMKGFDVLLDVLKVVQTTVLREMSVTISTWMDVAGSLPPSVRFKIYDLNDKCRC
jgi:hypothetical protein